MSSKPMRQMKTDYKYINFKVIREKPKTKVWGIFNSKSGAQLGWVAWYGPWRQYCFSGVDNNCIFNKDCLLDIVDFIEQLKGESKCGRE
jgi:hypothetical protein